MDGLRAIISGSMLRNILSTKLLMLFVVLPEGAAPGAQIGQSTPPSSLFPEDQLTEADYR